MAMYVFSDAYTLPIQTKVHCQQDKKDIITRLLNEKKK